MFEIYILALEVKFDLWGQRSSQHKIADLIYKVGKKRMMSISKSVLDLWVFKVFILSSEVKKKTLDTHNSRTDLDIDIILFLST